MLNLAYLLCSFVKFYKILTTNESMSIDWFGYNLHLAKLKLGTLYSIMQSHYKTSKNMMNVKLDARRTKSKESYNC